MLFFLGGWEVGDRVGLQVEEKVTGTSKRVSRWPGQLIWAK